MRTLALLPLLEIVACGGGGGGEEEAMESDGPVKVPSSAVGR